MTQQGLRQKTVRALTGRALTYTGDWHALFDQEGIIEGPFNGRMLRWINGVMGASFTSVGQAKQAFAEANGAFNWESMGEFAVWSPADLGASLLGAWDAERSDLITTIGAAVSSFRDVVAGYDATQGIGAARPLYSATSFNGRPGLTFDGLDDELTYAGVGGFPVGSAGGEIWALADQLALVADTGVRAFVSYGGVTGATSRSARRSVVAGVNRASAAVGDGSSLVVSNNTLIDLSGRHVLRVRTTPTNTFINVDGTEDPAPSSVVPNTGSTRTRLGATTPTTATQFAHVVLNYVAITGPLSADQAALMIQFLKTRGGIA